MASRSLLASLMQGPASAGSSRVALTAASRVGPSLVRHAHSHHLILDPKRDVVVDGKIVNPISPIAFSPKPPYAPLFPIYTPLSSITPTVPPAQAAETIVPLPRDIFGVPLRKDILHQCVVHHMTLLRQGTASSLRRDEVRGSGKKLRPQKGTGKARVGDSGSGIRVGGGSIHGPKPRDWSTDLTRKTRQLGFKIALSQRMREGRLRVVDSQGLVMDDWLVPAKRVVKPGKPANMVQAASKSAHIGNRLKELGYKKALFLHSPFAVPPSNLLPRSISNISSMRLASISSISTLDILKTHELVFDMPALEWLIAKVRQFDEAAYSAQFDGNAMVMRRRALGLSDFPEDGQPDESKEMLRQLEAQLGGEGEGDMTEFGLGQPAGERLSLEEEQEMKRRADWLLRVLPDGQSPSTA
ncbi:Mitochondrial/chloroplast ribosomal protein L4 [Phaffia rhodozyma]|uniref:Large ribosomal subunit protein uL4m n=1 Tax=Phaffia rhodozyma TaxID=264483 RepID=A0A0F7SL10_PHARH|nr:Mitochondrial/chloroplast ribosomal protein L4 [Phaffia rhodozyma]